MEVASPHETVERGKLHTHGTCTEKEKKMEAIMQTRKAEIINAVKTGDNATGKLYDYIANNYWQMSTDELKRVALEAIYALDACTKIDGGEWMKAVKTELIENLEEYL